MTDASPTESDADTGRISLLQIHRILAPTDLTKHSQKALNYATRLARHFGSKLTILHIHEDHFVFENTISPETAKVLQEERQRAENALLRIAEDIRSDHSNCDTYFQCGLPHEMIVKAARNLQADLIVLSTHDYRWFNHLLFGSEAEHILHHASCPVLVVHEHERDFVLS
jgi:nucleotide-binding universal stress UspA family protein